MRDSWPCSRKRPGAPSGTLTLRMTSPSSASDPKNTRSWLLQVTVNTITGNCKICLVLLFLSQNLLLCLSVLSENGFLLIVIQNPCESLPASMWESDSGFFNLQCVFLHYITPSTLIFALHSWPVYLFDAIFDFIFYFNHLWEIKLSL